MGLSSSQARLLTLTSRMHDIEYKAAKLEAQKLQMANESRKAYDDYLVALDATKIQMKTINTDGSLNYVDATYNNLLNAGYYIEFLETNEIWSKNGRVEDGKIAITQADKDNYDIASGNRDFFIALQTGRVDATGKNLTDGVYEIYLKNHLMNISSANNYRLMSNIDMTGQNWTSKLYISGKTFDGNGHSISGLNNSLFSSLRGNVKNLNLNVSIESTRTNIGAIAEIVGTGGLNEISNVVLTGSIKGTSNTNSKLGSIVGCSASSSTTTIYNVSSSIGISYTGSGEARIGGIVGENISSNLSISNAEYSGDITNTTGSGSGGGIIGLVQQGSAAYKTSITNSKTSGNITVSTNGGNQGCGGIIGTSWTTTSNTNSSKIENCTSSMDITADAKAGGLIGYFEGECTNASASGKISCNTANCGGIAGYMGSGCLDNCYASTTFYGTTNYGSIVGILDNSSKIKNSSASNTSIEETNSIGSGASNDSNSANMSTINSITVAPPNVSVIETVSDTGNFGYMFDMILAGNALVGEATDPTNNHQNDTEWLTNMINCGYIIICKQDKDNKYYETSVAIDTGLQEVSDETLLRKAEAKYEADMKKIDMKDRRYDTELAALDNERNAIKSEMETLKTVAKDNVERTFKLFS